MQKLNINAMSYAQKILFKIVINLLFSTKNYFYTVVTKVEERNKRIKIEK